MKFILEVGETETHLIEFSYNQLAGALAISVDKKPVVKSTRLFNEPVHEVFKLEVGGKQKSVVRIEKTRKQLFGHRNVVYVNDRLTRVVEGF